VSPTVGAEMLRDTLAIWWRLRVRHGYGNPGAAAPSPRVGDVGGVTTDHGSPLS